MTDDRELRALIEKASPLPWEAFGGFIGDATPITGGSSPEDPPESPPCIAQASEPDAALIVAAVNAMGPHLARIATLTAERDAAWKRGMEYAAALCRGLNSEWADRCAKTIREAAAKGPEGT